MTQQEYAAFMQKQREEFKQMSLVAGMVEARRKAVLAAEEREQAEAIREAENARLAEGFRAQMRIEKTILEQSARDAKEQAFRDSFEEWLEENYPRQVGELDPKDEIPLLAEFRSVVKERQMKTESALRNTLVGM